MRRTILDHYRAIAATVLRNKRRDTQIEAAIDGSDRHAAVTYVEANARNHSRFRFYVDSGDRFRDACRWQDGFAAYRAALDILPLHAGYIVQAGHCLKEMGRLIAAEGYYRSAILLGAPLGDVEEHLMFVATRNQYYQDPSKVRALAAAARANNPEVSRLPTLDDLTILADVMGIAHLVNINVLVDILRRGVSHADAASQLGEQFGCTGLPRSLRKLAAGNPVAREIALRPLNADAAGFNYQVSSPNGSGGMGAPPPIGEQSTPASPPEISGDGLQKTASFQISTTRADILELARAFAADRHDRAAPAFFGAVPAREDANNVTLQPDARPVVSVLILSYNGSRLALLAAGAVMAAGSPVPYEILIIDNASSAAERTILERADLPIRIVSLSTNRGFGEANNIGAEAARGEHLLFLNNDAFLAPRSIPKLLETLHGFEDCGAAGPVFRYPNGLLQEAGGFIEHNGSSVQRGKGSQFDPASLPPTDVVDYISGACLLMKRSTFMTIGGFHPNYDVAYCEDMDLCLRLLQHRKLSVLARDAVCFHIEGNTTGSSDLKRDIALEASANRLAFAGTWGPYLASRLSSDLAAGEALSSPWQPGLALNGTLPGTIVYADGSFRPHAAEQYLLALAAALKGDGRAVLAAPVRWSGLRLRNIQHWLQLPHALDGSIAADALSGKRVSQVLAAGSAAVPPLPEAERTVYVCHAPYLPKSGEDDQRAMDRLSRMDRIVVPSNLARSALLSLAERHRISLTSAVELVRPSLFSPLSSEDDRPRRPWVLSVGTIGDPVADGCLDELTAAFAATSEAFRRKWKLIVCGDVVDAGLAERKLSRIRTLAGDANVDLQIVVSPPLKRLQELYLSSSVYVQATGFGADDIEQSWRCDTFGTNVMVALAAGCQTFAWKLGAGAEIMDAVGAGRTFGGRIELTSMLEACGTEGIERAFRREAVARFQKSAGASATPN